MNYPVLPRTPGEARLARLLGLLLGAALLFPPAPIASAQPARETPLHRFSELSRQVAPAVVAISATTHSLDATGNLTPDQLRSALSAQRHAVGTGMFIHSDGFILTNEHVLAGRSEIWVTTDGGDLLPAVLVGADRRADLAVLKVPARNCPTVTFAKSPDVCPGQWTFTLGNPHGVAESGPLSMNVGIVSDTQRSLPELSRREQRDYADLIETTAAIAPGNSGGPVFNADGQVIGINSAAVLPGLLSRGAAYAFPVTPALLAKVEALRTGRADAQAEVPEILQPRLRWRGLLLAPVPAHWPSEADRDRRPQPASRNPGVLVLAIDPDSSFARSTLLPGTVITGVSGKPVRTLSDFRQLLAPGGSPGDTAAEALSLTIASAGTADGTSLNP